MADFCKQCAKQTFDTDTSDFIGATTKEAEANGMYAIVLCEGCGAIQVDSEGACISKDCYERHQKDKDLC